MGKAVLQLGHGANQKRGFSGAGARDQVEDEQVVGAEARAVVGGKPIVLAENVTLDLDDAVAAHAGDLLACRVGAAIDQSAIAGRVIMMMVMVVAVPMMMRMIVPMGMIMGMIMGVFCGRFGIAATAYRAHQSTSSSLTRMSSPSVTCN